MYSMNMTLENDHVLCLDFSTTLWLYASWSLTAARKLCCWELCSLMLDMGRSSDLWPLENRDGHEACTLLTLYAVARASFSSRLWCQPINFVLWPVTDLILMTVLQWPNDALKLETPNTEQSNCFHVSLRQTLPPGFLPAKQPKHQRHGLWSRVV
jgi:hypothetical protein